MNADRKTATVHYNKLILDELDRRDLTPIAIHMTTSPGEAVVLCEREGRQPYICWMAQVGGDGVIYFNWGHYVDDLATAFNHYNDRVRRYDHRLTYVTA